MRTVVWLLAAAVGVLNAGCAAIGTRPEVRGVRARVTGLDLEGVNLAFDVDVHNPYPVALKTPRFRYGIDIQETPFVESQEDARVDLPAGRVGTATLPVRLAYRDLWRIYQGLSGAAEVPYRLHGAFLISALGQEFELPIEHRGKFPVLKMPTFDVKGVEYSQPSLSGAGVTLRVEVFNPNVFDLDLRGLGYAARIGDVPVGELSATSQSTVAAGQSGQLNLTGKITARSALAQLLGGADLGRPTVTPTGTLNTPFGPVDLPR